jgi:hypothetical protein
MYSTRLYRASGTALLLGAILGAVGEVLNGALYPITTTAQQYLSATWSIVIIISFAGDILLLMGLPGIVARQGSDGGTLGLVGAVLTFLGGFMFSSFTLVSLAIFPWLARVAPNLVDGPPSLLVYFLVASIAFGLGGILLGMSVMRARILPYTSGLLLIIGTVLNAAAFPLEGALSSLISTVAYIIFAAGLGWMGYALIQERRAQAVMA